MAHMASGSQEIIWCFRVAQPEFRSHPRCLLAFILLDCLRHRKIVLFGWGLLGARNVDIFYIISPNFIVSFQ
jgi:hypothetical protein